MNLYTWLKRFSHLGGSRTKLAALWVMHVTHRRYLGIFIDTALSCNYSCRMCYFSNEEERRKRSGARMTEEQMEHVARSLFHRALKLQIGCGAEPTMDRKGALRLIQLGKQYGVPYISMTSNAALLQYENLLPLVEAGLDELTISLHGIHRDTYQYMMGRNADYDAFLQSLQGIKKLKETHPHFDVRVNYTMNADNVDELADFDMLFADIPVNQLQLRPVRKIGESEYTNFDLTHVSQCLESVIRPLAERCRAKGITVLFPEQIHINRFEGQETASPRENLIPLFTYINITPKSYPRHDIHFETESYEDYCRRTRTGSRLFKSIFASQKTCAETETYLTNSLNYDIR
ncbi:MAG: radical SAM protein [Paludibacteraceae bacterium]|nr:radical SAM protein [Paludibacteraceae bacterium]